MKIIKRSEAIANKRKTYFTGKECKNGNVFSRRTCNGECLCSDCDKKEQAKIRAKKSAEKNKDKIKARKSDYYQKNKSRLQQEARERGEAITLTDEQRIKRNKRARERYNKKINDADFKAKKNKSSQKWKEKNKDKIKEYNSTYKKENKSLCNRVNSERRASHKNAKPNWFGELDQFVIEQAYELRKERISTTGFDWHIDHMIPIGCNYATGLHCFNNIQVIPASINLYKSNKFILTEHLDWINLL